MNDSGATTAEPRASAIVAAMSASHRLARVVANEAISPTVRVLRLDFGALPLAFEAGQWLHLHVPTARGLEKRAYSIASAPGERTLELAITHVASGSVSPLLHALPVGSELACDGPHGFFTRSGELAREPALFVATGTGLCPLRSMLQERARGADPTPITLLFGVRSELDILWRDELERWARELPGFRLEVTLSRPSPDWSGRTGYVQRHVAELARALPPSHVFICGLNRMVADVRALCKAELGLDRKRVHSERYD